ncbi:M15 family metallopeptidase [Spirosoma oryzicola]|uniref:M15 family metallopeptidase n=1 Tax=Spirosoma oryzicola TaxID=2898794 RepID=UPI001E5311AD|nr:M15 family metallopeptidase [Spirosoma oryzicola]UHG93343.1 M15 family metallopeptidase [Spirosoma oryzicola]
MPSRSINDLHPALAYAWGKAQAKWALLHPELPQPFLTCTYRSNEEQDGLFKQKPKVTNARAGESPHNYQPSLAFDIAFLMKTGVVIYTDKWFDQFAPYLLETKGITWGGNFKSIMDRPHFELTDWKKLIPKK